MEEGTISSAAVMLGLLSSCMACVIDTKDMFSAWLMSGGIRA